MKRSKKTPSLTPEEVKERAPSAPVLVVGGEGSKPPKPLPEYQLVQCLCMAAATEKEDADCLWCGNAGYVRLDPERFPIYPKPEVNHGS